MINLKIDPEFQSQIPPLTDDEFKQLEENRIAVAGGVASNSALRAAMTERCQQEGIELCYPSPIFCTDNAAMIAVQGYYEYMAGTRSGLDLNAVPNLKIGQ